MQEVTSREGTNALIPLVSASLSPPCGRMMLQGAVPPAAVGTPGSTMSWWPQSQAQIQLCKLDLGCWGYWKRLVPSCLAAVADGSH